MLVLLLDMESQSLVVCGRSQFNASSSYLTCSTALASDSQWVEALRG